MTTMSQQRIEEAWDRIEQGDRLPAQIRVTADHPMDLFAHVDGQHRPGLLALSGRQPDTLPAYSAVEIHIGQRADGQWAVSLALAQQALRPMFAAMCTQIVALGTNTAPGTDAATFMLGQVARWHRLLALGPSGLLSIEEQQGLFGELFVLSEAVTRFGAVAVQGWIGPDDAPQDLELPTGPVEVKTVRAGQATVWISSAEQLDVDDGRLRLAVVDVVEAAPGTGGTSLTGQVATVREQLTPDPAGLQHFEEQLQKAGYIDRDEYGRPELRVTRVRWFAVRDQFPRLVRSQLPAAIGDTRYQLTLASLSIFEINGFETNART
jgi:hypothetical protein